MRGKNLTFSSAEFEFPCLMLPCLKRLEREKSDETIHIEMGGILASGQGKKQKKTAPRCGAFALVNILRKRTINLGTGTGVCSESRHLFGRTI